MPVYHVAVHTYRSWQEDDPRGFFNRDRGWHPPDTRIQRAREFNAPQSPVVLTDAQQNVAHDLLVEWTAENALRLYASATAPTHVHFVMSFETPPCSCDGNTHCIPSCSARAVAENHVRRFKQLLGYRLARHANTRGFQWLSSGWSLTPVRSREHLDHLVFVYLPKHESENGVYRSYFQ